MVLGPGTCSFTNDLHFIYLFIDFRTEESDLDGSLRATYNYSEIVSALELGIEDLGLGFYLIGNARKQFSATQTKHCMCQTLERPFSDQLLKGTSEVITNKKSYICGFLFQWSFSVLAQLCSRPCLVAIVWLRKS